MAQSTPASTFEADRLYQITVSKVVNEGPLRITPKNGATVTGAVAEKIKEFIVTSAPVE